MQKTIVVIGAGAAGFFSAIHAAEHYPGCRVIILEKAGKVLSKVKVSGGGRCNVTNACTYDGEFAAHYPRGKNFMKKVFSQFNAKDTIEWFRQEGVLLHAEADGRMFPVTNSSQTIIDCLQAETRRLGIEVRLRHRVTGLVPPGPEASPCWQVNIQEKAPIAAHGVLVTSGGHAQPGAYDWLSALGLKVEPPVPSLFTFNVKPHAFKGLSGISVPQGRVRLAGTKLSYEGPLLVTHWGYSGPAVLKLSAWGARWLAEQSYEAHFHVAWNSQLGYEQWQQLIAQLAQEHPKKQVATHPQGGLPRRLWQQLCLEAGISPDQVWGQLAKKSRNRLVTWLADAPFVLKGKTTFKEEFVTCGGVSLSQINPKTMQAQNLPGLGFAGEVLDIDGITGGFNFQAAWSTAVVAARNLF